MKKLYLKNWRDIRTRKAQFAALIVLVALGIATYVAFVSSYRNLSVSADISSEQLKLADFSATVLSAPTDVTDEIAALPGVAAVEGRLVFDTGLELEDGFQTTARIIGVPADRRPAVNDIYLEAGDYVDAGAPSDVILHSKFAEEAQKGLGDTLLVRDSSGNLRQLGITGIGASADYVWPIRAKGDIPLPREFAIIYMDQGEVERLFGREPSYNEFSMLVDPGADRQDVMNAVEDILEPYQLEGILAQEDLPSNFALHEEIRQNESLAYSMPLLILVISSLSLFIALSRLVQSQRGQIGLAKALGYGDLSILLHYLLFSLIIAVAGAVIGVAIGQLLGREITGIYIDMLNIPFLEHRVYASIVIWSFVISLAACVLAGLIPAWTSLRMTPANSMRVDPNLMVSRGKLPLVERVLSPLLPSSFTFRIPLRNIFRTKKRSVYTVIGIIFALVLTVTTWSLFDSMDYLIYDRLLDMERWDASAIYGETMDQQQLADIGSWDGVTQVQTARMIPARIEADGRSHEGLITATDQAADFHGFTITEGESVEAALADGSMVLPATLAEKLDVSVGDELRVRTPYLWEGRNVALGAISDEVWGTSTFVSTDTGGELLPGAPAGYNAVYLKMDKGQSDDIRKQLYSLPGAEVVLIRDTMVEGIEGQLGFLNLFGGILLTFAFTMAFVVIYNTFTANIIERTREIATMRTIGEDGGHLAAMITMENLLLALIGIPLGLAAGLWAASKLYGSLSTEAYSFKAVLYPTSYLWIILCILAVLLVSEVAPIRRVFKLDLAEATKFVE